MKSMCQMTPRVSQLNSIAGSAGGAKEPAGVRAGFLAKLKVASGLAELANRKYKAAARHFLQVWGKGGMGRVSTVRRIDGCRPQNDGSAFSVFEFS